MNTKLLCALSLAGAISAGGAGAIGAETSTAADPDAFAITAERATRVLGREVRNVEGREIAEVENLLVDLESGRMVYVVLDLDGSQRNVAVPLHVLVPVGRDFRFTADAAKLADAPECLEDFEAEQRSSAFISRVNLHFETSNAVSAATIGATGTDLSHARFIRDLIGSEIRGASGGRIGKVETLAMDFPAQRVAYVIITPERELKLENRSVPLPPGVLRVGAGDALTTTVTMEQIRSAPLLGRNDWLNLSNPTWAARVYRHFGSEAYFESNRLQPTGEPRDSSNETNRLEKIYHEPEKD